MKITILADFVDVTHVGLIQVRVCRAVWFKQPLVVIFPNCFNVGFAHLTAVSRSNAMKILGLLKM